MYTIEDHRFAHTRNHPSNFANLGSSSSIDYVEEDPHDSSRLNCQDQAKDNGLAFAIQDHSNFVRAEPRITNSSFIPKECICVPTGIFRNGKMDRKEIIKRQFDIQAQNFSNWSVTKNEGYMQAYFEFIDFQKGDELLDVACGTGEFSVFCARKIKRVRGIDISERMIELGQELALNSGLDNVAFECHDVEHIPCANNSFSVVQCRSAFHHMENFPEVFKEMLRCCKPDGVLAVHDIMAYSDPKINSFFEALEKEIDISHNSTLHKHNFIDLFHKNQVEVIRSFVVEIELNFHEYLGHAHQSERSLAKIKELLEDGLRDREISRFLYMNKEMELVIKRSVFLILGRKRRSSSITLSRTSAGSYIPGHK